MLVGPMDAQKQGDRSHKYYLPNILQGMQDRMAGHRAEERLLMSDIARGSAGSRQTGQNAAQPSQPSPIPQDWSEASKQC